MVLSHSGWSSPVLKGPITHFLVTPCVEWSHQPLNSWVEWYRLHAGAFLLESSESASIKTTACFKDKTACGRSQFTIGCLESNKKRTRTNKKSQSERERGKQRDRTGETK